MRKLVSIKTITAIEPIENADFINLTLEFSQAPYFSIQIIIKKK